MAAELVWRGLANGAVIFAIVWVLRRRGQRAAGLLAALPMLCAPALFTLSVDHSPSIATAAAVAGLHATGLTASLVLLYGVARRPLGTPLALLFSGLGAVLIARLGGELGHDLAPTLALTLVLVGLARRFVPRLAPCGSICPFVRGYLDGLLVRSTLLAALALGLAPLGGWLAFPLATLAAVAVLAAITGRCQPGGGAGCAAAGGSATTRAERS
jgi:hypothetical protein